MGSSDDHTRFRNIGYDDFRAMAGDESLSRYQKIGFPDEYRKGKESDIYRDICSKLPALEMQGSIILDVGCGCSDLPRLLIKKAELHKQKLLMVDSSEMLALLSDGEGVEKIAAHYPEQCPELFERYREKVQAVLIYSVIQYVFAEGNLFTFLDRTLELLASGGRLLIGDIPNVSMRKRFFASESGIRSHRQFTGKDEMPVVHFNTIEHGNIDDTIVLAMVARSRAAGYHAFILPQPDGLPMANRREDVLIVKP